MDKQQWQIEMEAREAAETRRVIFFALVAVIGSLLLWSLAGNNEGAESVKVSDMIGAAKYQANLIQAANN